MDRAAGMTEFLTAPDPAPEASGIEIVQLTATFEAFGLIVDFLARHPPFASFEARALAEAVQAQLRNRHHLIAMRGESVVGYAGWLLTTRPIGEAWVAGLGPLTPVAAERADAASLTIVVANEPSSIRRMLRGARVLNPGRRVYFKRDANGTQGVRKRSVHNEG